MFGPDIPGADGIGLDTTGTSGFDGPGIVTFAGIGDLNGDGKDDIAAGSKWANARDDVTVGNFTIFGGLDKGDDAGISRPDPLFRTPGADRSLEGFSFSDLGDFDGDGNREFLVGRDHRVQGDGNHLLHEIDANGIVAGTRIASLGGTESNFVGDLNGDGFDDILMTAPDGRSILFGNAAGDVTRSSHLDGFGSPSIHQRGRAASGNGDLNDDGFDDLAVIDTRTDTVRLLFGREDLAAGQASAIRPDASIALPHDVLNVELLQDFNGDNVSDLLVSWRGGAAVIFGAAGLTGDITIAELEPADGVFLTIGNLNHMARSAGDLNGDGLSDINWSDRVNNQDQTGILFGQSEVSGAFGFDGLDGQIGIRIDAATSGSGIGDVNGDGFQDLMLRAGNGASSFNAVLFGREHATRNIEEGSAAADTLGGSALKDLIIGGDGDDRINGGDGDDILRGAYGNDTLSGGAGADTLIGGEGRDVADYSESSSGVSVFLAVSDGRGGDAEGDDLRFIEDISGSAFDDRLIGDASANVISGVGGNDVLHGAGGDDTLHGGLGADRLLGGRGNDLVDGGGDNDVLRGGDGADTMLGGSGDDTLRGDEGSDHLFGGIGNDILRGLGDDDLLEGNAGDDTLFGNQGLDTLLGGDGADSIFGGVGGDILDGGDGGDLLDGGDGRDSVLGGDGTDTLRGGRHDDTLDGGAGDDVLFGMHGDDVIRGGAGNDTIRGSDGDDTITGGDGADLFVFDMGSCHDVILDFDAAEGDLLGFWQLGTSLRDVTILRDANGVTLSYENVSVRLEGAQNADLDFDQVAFF